MGSVAGGARAVVGEGKLQNGVGGRGGGVAVVDVGWGKMVVCLVRVVVGGVKAAVHKSRVVVGA